MAMSKHDLGCAISDEGGWEEFHQKRHNYVMFDYHKGRRLAFERVYRWRFGSERTGDVRG